MLDATESVDVEQACASGRTATTRDGWIYEIETGEILGHADVLDRFEVNSADAADWVLGMRSAIEADIVATDLRLRAVTEQLKAIRREHERKLAWWEWRFRPSLVAFARSVLAGRKERTARFTWGSVSFRRTQGSRQILDMEAAVAWMKTASPGRVKVVESVTVTDVVKAAGDPGDGDALSGFRWLSCTGPGESVKITTGVE